MKNKTFKISIHKNFNEVQFYETLLNYAYQYNPQTSKLMFSIYALAKKMHIDDFVYYFDLIEEAKA